MSRRTIALTDDLHQYLLDRTLREPKLLAELREETAGMPGAGMQIAPDQGQFMALLVRLSGARRILEVGTFTGYSALVMTLAMPSDGRLVALDISEEYTNTARRYWERAGVADRIDLRVAPALDSLAIMEAAKEDSFDVAFIDADKENYGRYFDSALSLLRPGGLIMVDNVLWDGAVLKPDADCDDDTLAIKRFNEQLHADERVAISMAPIGDGLTLAVKL